MFERIMNQFSPEPLSTNGVRIEQNTRDLALENKYKPRMLDIHRKTITASMKTLMILPSTSVWFSVFDIEENNARLISAWPKTTFTSPPLKRPKAPDNAQYYAIYLFAIQLLEVSAPLLEVGEASHLYNFSSISNFVATV